MLNSKNTESKAEFLSSIYDGENLPKEDLQLDEQAKSSMQAWSMIGATLRNELPSKVNTSFADNVMNSISQITPNKVDQSSVEQKPTIKFNMIFKKFGFAISQIAIAASIAMVTVVGYQTWNAESNLNISEPAVNATLGSVSGVNLASYQNNPSDGIIKFDENQAQEKNANQNTATRDNVAVKEMQNKEVELINNYIRGYVLNTAANK